MKPIYVRQKKNVDVVIAALNSSLFCWYNVLCSNCRDLTLREINSFPLTIDAISPSLVDRLSALKVKLMKDYQKNAFRKECYYKKTGKVVYDEYYPKLSKSIIDEIDKVLAKHYGFTEEELDFIINYDIKYRMGDELSQDEE